MNVNVNVGNLQTLELVNTGNGRVSISLQALFPSPIHLCLFHQAIRNGLGSGINYHHSWQT